MNPERSAKTRIVQTYALETSLGKALVDILNRSNGSLGTELHFIGRSYGGGVMGRVARILAEQGHPATSLTTLNTQKLGCLGSEGCLVNTPKNVEPGVMQTLLALSYYPEVDGGGFGEPIPASYSNLTNLRLEPDLVPPLQDQRRVLVNQDGTPGIGGTIATISRHAASSRSKRSFV